MIMPANFSAPIVHYWAGTYPGRIGWLIGPAAAAKTCVRPWLPYGLDNDAYQAFTRGVPWDEAAFFALLAWARRQVIAPRWVIVPDVVADAAATLRNWLRYASVVAASGWPLAFAVQDGMMPADVPSNAEVVFVGGSTPWKWRTVAYLTQHRQKGTVRGVINPPMNKRNQLPTGWPDFTFVYRGKAVALEAKMPGKKAEPHQEKCHDDMRADGWFVMVVHSVDDAAAVLDAVDYAVDTGR